MPDTQKRVASPLNTTNLKQLEVEMQKAHNKLAYSVRAERQVSDKVHSAEGLGDRPNEKTGTILIVDDEEIVLETFTRMLERLDYCVFKAGSGMAAIDVYEDKMEEIDLIILDMIMPKMDGRKTYEKIKEINPNAKVLLASGYSIGSQVAEELKNGCNGFIQKPFNLRTLSGKLRDILVPTNRTF